MSNLSIVKSSNSRFFADNSPIFFRFMDVLTSANNLIVNLVKVDNCVWRYIYIFSDVKKQGHQPELITYGAAQ